MCRWLGVVGILVVLITGCATTQWPSQTKNREYLLACNTKPFKASPDVRYGLKVTKSEQRYWDLFNDEPRDELMYQNTEGFVTQPMRAVARMDPCPLGGKVTLRRPIAMWDEKFNRGSCPPGLNFSSSNSTTIVGTPTQPGRYTTKVLLCGQCAGSVDSNWYPVTGTIEWVIKGRAPKRLQ